MFILNFFINKLNVKTENITFWNRVSQPKRNKQLPIEIYITLFSNKIGPQQRRKIIKV